MDRRLKIMTIAISAIYVAIIGGHIYREMADFAYGFKQGMNVAYEGIEKGKIPTPSTSGTFFLSLKPEAGLRTFPTMMRNQLDRKPMKTEIEKMVVEGNVSDILPRGTIIADICSIFLSFFVLFVMILIPVQTFRILRSVTKDKIFDPSNIRKMRLIGYALLTFYIANLIFSFLHYRIAASVIEVDGYSLQMDWGNTSLVLLGFVVLMFAEVLKVSVQMKEEQELTV
jgi:hypothetical protein